MKKTIFALFCLIALSSFSFAANQAEEVIDQKDVTQLNKMSDPKSVPDAADTIEDWAYNAIEKFGVSEFGEHNGKFFFFASQTVSLKPTDPQFGDALINAYDKAMMRLQNKYLMTRFGNIVTEKVKSFYSNRSTDAKEIQLPNPNVQGFLGKVLKIVNKHLDVTEKKLDKELIKLGTDPQELAKMTPKMKKDTFRDKFLKNSIQRASGSIAGLFPIQTSVATDSSGRYVVGVIAIATAKTIQIAKDIKLQRKSLIRGKGRDVKELLPATKDEYLSTFGVRLAYDKDGTPMIISYGLGSYSNDGDDYIKDQLRVEAKENAVSNANAQIAEVVNGYMNIKESRTTGEEIRKYVEREMKPDSDTVEKTIKNIIKITNNRARSRASMKLQGTSVVKTWRYTTDKGVKFVGVVKVWKYSTLKAVKDFNAGKYHSKKKRTKHTYKRSLKQSKTVNDINDF